MTCEDVTDRKRTEEALRESEEKYRSLVANAMDAIFIVQDGLIKFPNARTSERAPQSILYYKGILGSSKDEYVSKVTEISDEDLMKNYLDAIYSLLSIQMKKNRYLRWGSESLIISILLLVLSFVLHNL